MWLECNCIYGQLVEKDTPYNLINKVQGKVHCFNITKSDLEKAQKDYSISNIQHTLEGYKVKIVSDIYDGKYGDLEEAANLEDVYLYYF